MRLGTLVRRQLLLCELSGKIACVESLGLVAWLACNCEFPVNDATRFTGSEALSAMERPMGRMPKEFAMHFSQAVLAAVIVAAGYRIARRS